MVWFRDDGLDAGSETAGSAGAISHGVVADLKRVQAPASERRRENPQVFLSHLLLFSNLMMVLIAMIIFTLHQQTSWGVWMYCSFWTLDCQSLPRKHSTCSLFFMFFKKTKMFWCLLGLLYKHIFTIIISIYWKYNIRSSSIRFVY